MIKSNLQVEILLNELIKSHKNVGIKGTIYALKQHPSLFKNSFETTKSFIIKKICIEFDLEEDDLINGKERNDNRLHALGFSVYLLRKFLKINGKEAGLILNKDESSVCRYQAAINSLKPDNTKGKDLIDKLNSLEEDTEEYIQYLNSQKKKSKNSSKEK